MPDDTSAFRIDPRLTRDAVTVADLPLSRVLLSDDARFLWLVAVPRRAGLVEMLDLGPDERARLRGEIDMLARAVRSLSPAAKLNIAALGNVVPQLHVHVIARHPGDAAWPGPVWGHGERVPYEADAAHELAARLRAALARDLQAEAR